MRRGRMRLGRMRLEGMRLARMRLARPLGMEMRVGLAAQPPISVPTVVLHGEGDGVTPPAASLGHARFFTGPYSRRVIPLAGHNLPQEVPDAVSAAVLDLLSGRVT